MNIREDTRPQPDITPPAGSIAMPLSPQPGPGVVTAPRDWSLWLLPTVLLMFLAGAVVVYFIPTNLDLLLPLSFWLLGATVLLGVVACRTILIVTSPSNNVERRKRNGKVITWNPFASISAFWLAIILTGVLATGGMFASALNRSSFYSVYNEVEGPLVLLVTSSIVIILLIFIWLAPIGPLQKLFQLRFAGFGALIIPIVIYLAVRTWLPSMLPDPFDSTGPFSSWPAVLQFARHEADRIDEDAIIYDVSVISYPADGPYSPQTSPLAMNFRFVRPTGEGISIEILDTNPVQLIYVDKEDGALISSFEYANKRFEDWFASIKLGPRDVYSLTEKEAIAFAQGNGINVAKFEPGLDIMLENSVPAVWHMDYISKFATEWLDLDVDSATGTVLARNSMPDESTTTPTPPPTTASPVP